VSQRGDGAVVCGASMAGLLAARVLSEFYASVTVVERDVLLEAATPRRGLPQARHLHQLLSRGSMILSELFPGLFDDLLAAGANVIDDPSLAYIGVGDHVLVQHGHFANPEEMLVYSVSRPLLEAQARQRVQAIENVTLLDGHDVVEPILGHADRVTAVRVVSRETKQERTLAADLVLDATGRSARTPAFLQTHGYPRPREQTYAVNLSYTSQTLRMPNGSFGEKVVVVAPTIERSTGAGILAYEEDTAVLTLIGVAGKKLPADLPGLLSSAAGLLPPRITAALRAAEPLGEVSAQHYPASVWRRYDKLARFPKGLLVIGDAVCSLNPVYGQGMTSAALQAKVLRQCLAANSADDVGRRYFATAAKRLAPMWQANRINDFAVAPADGWRSIPQRLLNWHTDKVMAAAADDIVLTEAFMRVLQLLDPPVGLLRPALSMRVITGNRRRSRCG
jgi:2-polyprenyl-6-methoxyphenol hydroxylase-like FAD-dependent oxidoreductase